MSLRIRVELPRVHLNIAEPRIEVDLQHPEVRISQEQPRVLIDQTAPLADIGLKRSLALARSSAADGRERAAEATVAYAREGDMYLDVHKGVTVGQVIKARTQEEVPELNIEALPRSRPAIEAVEGELAIDVVPGGVRVQAHLGKVALELEEGQVTVSAKDVPRVGETVDLRI